MHPLTRQRLDTTPGQTWAPMARRHLRGAAHHAAHGGQLHREHHDRLALSRYPALREVAR